MNLTTLIALGIALGAGLGILITAVGVNLLTGSFYFLFGKARFKVLKSEKGLGGFAFQFTWNSSREPVSYDEVKLRLFNPGGKPSQIEVAQSFPAQKSDFALDLDFGRSFAHFFRAEGIETARVQWELKSSRDGIVQQGEYPALVFRSMIDEATQTVAEASPEEAKAKPLYTTVERSFVAEPLTDESRKTLVVTGNPQFAELFTGGGGKKEEATQENFAVTKVWIEPGCIVCDACEAIYPEVFEVQDETCIIREGAPLDNGILIEEAAEACPVEVIKFTKTS